MRAIGLALCVGLLAFAGPIALLPAAHAAEGSTKPGQSPAPPWDARYVPLDPLVVPITDAGQLRGRIFLTLAIDAGSGEAAAALRDNPAPLRARLYLATFDFAVWQGTARAPLNLPRLAGLLQAELPKGWRILILRAYAR